ncbi:MAG: hypothetical protein CM1200mP30_27050 [Pseudomonadota bacterium]|nr:MAG: hypothetical protein CM1200mP30_27050 [Pseudomonadota bacterium]
MLAIDGQQFCSSFDGVFMNNSPAITRGSLFAAATVLPAFNAENVGFNPAAPTIPDTTRFNSGLLRSVSGLSFRRRTPYQEKCP